MKSLVINDGYNENNVHYPNYGVTQQSQSKQKDSMLHCVI